MDGCRPTLPKQEMRHVARRYNNFAVCGSTVAAAVIGMTKASHTGSCLARLQR